MSTAIELLDAAIVENYKQLEEARAALEASKRAVTNGEALVEILTTEQRELTAAMQAVRAVAEPNGASHE